MGRVVGGGGPGKELQGKGRVKVKNILLIQNNLNYVHRTFIYFGVRFLLYSHLFCTEYS